MPTSLVWNRKKKVNQNFCKSLILLSHFYDSLAFQSFWPENRYWNDHLLGHIFLWAGLEWIMSHINRKHNQPNSPTNAPEVHHYNAMKFQLGNASPLLRWKETNSPSCANPEDVPEFTGLVWIVEVKINCA